MERRDVVVSRQPVERTKSTAPSFAHTVFVLGVVGAAALAVWKLSDVLVLAFGAIAVRLFAALYFTAQPTRYVDGLLRLVPSPYRDGASEMLELLGATLRRWIIAQSITMAVVGTLTAIGLALLGVSAPIALGLFSGMFAFVPYVGSITASVSGILMASMRGPVLVGYVIALYAGIHFVEGNIITPLVQAEAVELPPGLTLFATLVFGLLLGPVGVLLAAPLAVVLLVLVNALYVEGILGERRARPST